MVYFHYKNIYTAHSPLIATHINDKALIMFEKQIKNAMYRKGFKNVNNAMDCSFSKDVVL